MKMKSLTLGLLICAALVFSPLTANAANPQQNPHHIKHRHCYSHTKIKLNMAMRKLWMDHTLWTRNYIISALAGLPDQKPVLARLLKNQEDIGNAIKPYYGEAAGNELTKLLKEHILLAGSVVDAAKTGNQASLKKFNDAWYQNADQIAKFLSKANPHWSYQKMKELLDAHLKLTTDEVVSRLKKDWNADIMAYDHGETHIIKLADALSNGIIKQFPAKFK